jgi:uncharacterized membrane protein YeaQ/YmgE (transglycosylase-associated protein family)
MGIITWILLGLVAGAIAKFLMPGRDPGGTLITILLGIFGAFVGGWVGTILGFGRVDGFDLRGLFISVIGAILVLIAHRMIAKPKS